MNLSLPRIVLPLLMALAFVVRWEPTRTLRLAPDERDGTSSQWLIDDPETCQELRRVELAIASDKVVEFDRFVNFPAGGEIPALPFFDSLVAGTAQRFLRTPTGEAALGQVDEADLEDFIVKLAPILGLLAVLATYWAARTIVTGPRGDVAALIAAAIVAFQPATIAASSAGKLHSSALSVILFALLIRCVVRSIRGTTMPTTLLDALVAGALSGLLVSSTAIGFLLFLPAWVAFFVHTLRSSGEARANALRSGLLFSVVAAFLSRLTLSEGPWEQGAGVVHGFVSGVSMLVLMSTAPYVVLILLKKDEKPRLFRTACFLAALGVMAWQLPQVWIDLAPSVRWYLANRADIGVLMTDVHSSRDALPGFSLFALSILIALLLTSAIRLGSSEARSDSGTLALFFFAPLLAVVSIATGLAIPFLVVAVAILTARALDAGLASAVPGEPKRNAIAASIITLALVVTALAPAIAKPDPVERERRIDFVAGLRWMRTHTESGGAWNSPHSPSGWGVLSSISTGPLVQYHARRPAAVSPWALLSGRDSMREWMSRYWGGVELDAVAHFMRGQGARYVVVGSELDRRDSALRPDRSTGRPVLPASLVANEAGRPASDPTAAFERVFASKRLVDANGRTTLDAHGGRPVISIWQLEAKPNELREAGLSPR